MRKKLAELRKGDLPLCKLYEPYHSVLKTQSDYSKLSFNKSVFSYLERMKTTAANYKIVYLTSNQVFSRESLFVIKKDFKDHKWIDQSYTSSQSYRGYINPQINEYLGQKQEVWQKCMSSPYIQCKVRRNTELKVSYVNEKRQNVKEQLFGFKAYVFQHCIDHLKGKCIWDWNLCRGMIRVYPEAQDLFPKTKFVLKDYSMRIKDAISKRKSQSQDQQIILTEQQKNYQKKEEEVLRKVIQEQINALSQKYGK